MTLDKSISDDELTRRLQSKHMMKRDRDIDEYEKVLALNITTMARQTVAQKGGFIWYDMCCGELNAGYNLKHRLMHNGDEEIAARISIVGVDIDDALDKVRRIDGVTFERGNVVSHPIKPQVDLITCVNSLYCVEEYLYKAEEAVRHWFNSMPIGTTLAFDIPQGLVRVGLLDFPEYLKQRLGNGVKVEPQSHSLDYRIHIQKKSMEQL